MAKREQPLEMPIHPTRDRISNWADFHTWRMYIEECMDVLELAWERLRGRYRYLNRKFGVEVSKMKSRR